MMKEDDETDDEKELLIEQLKNLINEEQINYSKSLMEKNEETEKLKNELEEYTIKK